MQKLDPTPKGVKVHNEDSSSEEEDSFDVTEVGNPEGQPQQVVATPEVHESDEAEAAAEAKFVEKQHLKRLKHERIGVWPVHIGLGQHVTNTLQLARYGLRMRGRSRCRRSMTWRRR